MSGRKGGEPADSTFIRFMECTKPSDRAHIAIQCMSIRRRIDDEEDHTLATRAEFKTAKSFRVREWFGV